MEGVPVVVAWHKSQDGLLHKVVRVEPDVPVRVRSGPDAGKLFRADRLDTACGWGVFAARGTVTTLDALQKGIPSCFECVVAP